MLRTIVGAKAVFRSVNLERTCNCSFIYDWFLKLNLKQIYFFLKTQPLGPEQELRLTIQ